MRISNIKTHVVQVGIRDFLLVKIETDSGLYGWGESGFSSREKSVEQMVQHFARFLIGQDPMNIGRIWQECYRSHYFEGGRVTTAAISAIDIALYDIKGKALGVPVYQLLGGKQRNYVKAFATVPNCSSEEETLRNAKKLKDMGWDCIRFVGEGVDHAMQHGINEWEPRKSIAQTVPLLIKARELLGHEILIGLEYHHRLSVAEAASLCQKLPSGTIDFLEEAIRDETPEAYESLRTLTNIPFAIGEEFSSKWQFLPYLERGIFQYNRLDICNVGGFTEAMKIAGWSEAHYVDLLMHNPLGPICTAASVHLAAAIPNFSHVESNISPLGDTVFEYKYPDLFPIQPKLKGTHYEIPEIPGLGVDVNEEMLQDYSVADWEAPHTTREDGSVQNW
ncbi:mandelate racemase/muconate lactonizing enzyme family protein [Vibrio panuliri]|uniref:Galactonate dehydratase n=1 Tax=Vibrio panuliri TaxID=1381081 RepID=A0A1Q9HDY5_9VIBR|nr:mandelate racemase/muconate lactonizing enzyme family protein [Vibrio panuliri]KAB1454915.1 mandelate racemase/muconate lactonizing enzyme family protein [Vibrio panuliri]OLQ87919.1 galactonate dehydratase [Vibrio panuliri]OLQ95283.1 galactonate dehydratase [Vibrio panuliri]